MMLEVTGLHVPAAVVGVSDGVAVRVGVGVGPVGVKVGLLGVQVGAWVGMPKLPCKLLLDSLVSVIILVVSTVAVELLAAKMSVTDWPAAKPLTVCATPPDRLTEKEPFAGRVPILATTT